MPYRHGNSLFTPCANTQCLQAVFITIEENSKEGGQGNRADWFTTVSKGSSPESKIAPSLSINELQMNVVL